MSEAPAGQSARRRTLAVLMPATLFDGYDGLLLGLALPLIRSEFGLSLAEAGVVGSVVFSGAFGSLVLIALADRIGRRMAMTVSIGGYTVATFLTALSRGVVDFVVLQFVARVFLGAERTLANIVVVESMPPQRRGRSLGLLSAMFAVGQAAAGAGFLIVNQTGASWRWLYLVGIGPLVLVARARRDLPDPVPGRDDAASRPGAAVNRRWLAGASVLGFLFALFPTALIVFASTIVLEDWGWDLGAINPLYFVWWALALTGFLVAGRLMDSWGRRPTAVVFFAGAALAGVVAFGVAETESARALGLAVVIFFLTGSTPCLGALTTEPFPVRVRGRVGAVVRLADIGGSVAAPALAGVLAATAGGAGAAVGLVGLSYALGAGTVLAVLPETRGMEPGWSDA